ncbi:MAG: type III secretion system export apparatus subunit SctT [Janthinobacterium lividum]
MAVDVTDALRQLMPWVSAAALAMGRPTGAALVLPVFTRAQLGGAARGALAFALGLAMMPALARALPATSLSSVSLLLLGAKELIIGLVIGVLVGVPIWSVQCVGEILDTQRSATQDKQPEPNSGNQDSTTATFLGITVVALFVISGGLGALARTIDDSYVAWPVLQLMPSVSRDWIPFGFGVLDRITATSLALAAPVMLGMLLCEMCVILLMRAVPKLQLYDLAPTLRNLMFILMMFGYASWLVTYMRAGINQIRGVDAALTALLR